MINRELIRLKVVQLIYAYYQNEGRSYDVAEKELTFSLSKSYDLYHYLLQLLVELQKYATRKDEVRLAREKRTGVATSSNGVHPDKQFAENKFLNQLLNNKQLGEYIQNHPSDWSEEENFVKDLYAQFIDSDIFQLYINREDFSYEADRELVRKLYKTFICNNEKFDALLEEQCLYWNDDKDIIDSFILKTIKRFKEEAGEEQALLPDYASEEDKEFALTLFAETLKNEEELRNLIRNNCKNWEFNRLAFMDVIIMQIALAEILTFPSIPLNVSFNEYLDIAKIYSTPRSSSYINGLLDHIVKYLKKENKLFK
ncbi:MAG: transcription antitermination factor NusB [Bacteroidaceae bacterium]|nr:transcription antitermination factor NusB [Bacteroidaceae bacterium]